MKCSITIGRQFGSMGSDISKIISNHYFMPIYRHEDLLHETEGIHAEKSMIESNATNSFIYSLAMDVYNMEYSDNPMQLIPTDHKKFIVQCNKIKEIHKKTPSIFVGRASDYALQGLDNVINLFFYADFEQRANRIAQMRGITLREARRNIVKIDKDRARYYNYYTNKKWGDPKSYDLCLNTTKLSPEQCADIVIKYIDYMSNNKMM